MPTKSKSKSSVKEHIILALKLFPKVFSYRMIESDTQAKITTLRQEGHMIKIPRETINRNRFTKIPGNGKNRQKLLTIAMF